MEPIYYNNLISRFEVLNETTISFTWYKTGFPRKLDSSNTGFPRKLDSSNTGFPRKLDSSNTGFPRKLDSSNTGQKTTIETRHLSDIRNQLKQYITLHPESKKAPWNQIQISAALSQTKHLQKPPGLREIIDDMKC
jgi:hypothetical protein